MTGCKHQKHRTIGKIIHFTPHIIVDIETFIRFIQQYFCRFMTIIQMDFATTMYTNQYLFQITMRMKSTPNARIL